MLDKFKDECGVFGIFGHPEAANLTYLGLYALQHRGQESAGIVAADGEQMRVSRAMGHVADAFDEQTLEKLPGTSGDRPHPLLDRRREQARERAADPDRLRARPDRHRPQRQPRQRAASCATSWSASGSIFQTSSDTEVVLHLYARSKAPSVEEALVESIVAGAAARSRSRC